MKTLSAIVLFATTLLFAIPVQSNEIKLVKGKTSSFSFTTNDYQNLTFTSSFSQLKDFVVKHESGSYNQLLAKLYGTSMAIGDPQLPVLKKIIEIPEGAELKIEVLKETYQEFNLADLGIENPIFPVQAPVSKSTENPDDIPFAKNEITYNTDSYFGQKTVVVELLGIMRSVNLARLEVSPIEYNPVQHSIRVCVDLEVKISFTGGNAGLTKNKKKDLFSPYFEGAYKQIANYKPEITDELIMDEPITYIIVSDPMFETTLQPFIEWKTKKGFHVVEAYTNDAAVGTTTTSIKSYLQDSYNSPPTGVNAQSFVLFVGDIGQIPTYDGTSGSHVTDLYYCDYTGDIYPECYYGRFSAESTAELQPQIDKTLEYEQYLMPDPSFLDEVVMVAGDDSSHELTYGNGQVNYGTTYYYNLAHGITSHTYLQDEPSGGNYSENIRQNVSDGIAFGNYSAHCSSAGWADPSFVNSHIDALTNAHKYPLLVGNCCLSNKFDDDDCFGENLLKAVDKGALGYIGGSNSTYWDEDFWWGVGYESISANPTYNAANLGSYDRAFHEQGEALSEWYVTQGQMPSAGNLAVTQAGSSRETYYWEIYHLMGDPSLMVYFTQPPVTTASYDGLMPLGSTSFTVNTQAYAYVAISKDGVLHGAAVANGSGVATLTLNPINVPGTADVVITRQNGQPFMGTVSVASPSGPYLSLESFVIDDNAGNDNGEADYNETILLDISIENLGSSAATNVSATISTSDSYAIIENNSNVWPNIPNGTISTENGAFEVTFTDDIPDQHMVTFDMEITDGSEIWDAQINISVNAPVFVAKNMIIDDIVGGNGNGRLDAGETADIYLELANDGHSISPAGMAVISTISPYVTMNADVHNFNAIPVGNTEMVMCNLTLDINTPIGTSFNLLLDVDAGNYDIFKQYAVTVGLVLEDWETGNFNSFPWVTSGNTNWAIATDDVYEGTYSAKSGLIDHSQTSVLEITVTTTVNDTISFYKRVSSESGYDYLKFYVDGTMSESWSGDNAWSRVSYFVTAGVHTFKWSYEKDGSVSSGSDCAWVDYIVFPPIGSAEPDLFVSTNNIDFSDVIINTISTEGFTVTNNGSNNLIGTIVSPIDFTISDPLAAKTSKKMGKNQIDFILSPGVSKSYDVHFEPLVAQCYSGNVQINSNDPDTPIFYLGVSGCGAQGPNLALSSNSFDVLLPVDNTTSELLNISNKGDMDLTWSAQIVYNDGSKNTTSVYPQNSSRWTGSTGGSTITNDSEVIGVNPEDGWFMFDVSTIPVGATINSIEFFGYVNSTNYPYWSLTPLTNNPLTIDAATLYADINAEASTDFYLYQNEGSDFTTGWKNHILGGTANSDLETALAQGWFAMGMAERDNSATYFLNWDGWNEANPPYLVIDYTYNPTVTWLTIDGNQSASGNVIAGEDLDIDIVFDATGLTVGTYDADILLTTNDPNNANKSISVSLEVYTSLDAEFQITALLEGPFNGTDMLTDLNTKNSIPLNQPFNTAPWNYSGAESVASLPAAEIVDWVLVEIRTAPSVEDATSATTLAKQACFILSDGSIVGTDRIADNDVIISDLSTLYGLYVVIWHRNHLGVISAYHPDMTGADISYDFTLDVATGTGGANGQTNLGGDIFGMVAGDGNCDGNITEDDLNLIWYPNAGKSGYIYGDYDLDGQVENKDKNDRYFKNLNSNCQVPD